MVEKENTRHNHINLCLRPLGGSSIGNNLATITPIIGNNMMKAEKGISIKPSTSFSVYESLYILIRMRYETIRTAIEDAADTTAISNISFLVNFIIV